MKIYNEVTVKFNDKTNEWDTISEDSFEHDGQVDLAQGADPGYGRYISDAVQKELDRRHQSNIVKDKLQMQRYGIDVDKELSEKRIDLNRDIYEEGKVDYVDPVTGQVSNIPSNVAHFLRNQKMEGVLSGAAQQQLTNIALQDPYKEGKEEYERLRDDPPSFFDMVLDKDVTFTDYMSKRLLSKGMRWSEWLTGRGYEDMAPQPEYQNKYQDDPEAFGQQYGAVSADPVYGPRLARIHEGDPGLTSGASSKDLMNQATFGYQYHGFSGYPGSSPNYPTYDNNSRRARSNDLYNYDFNK